MSLLTVAQAVDEAEKKAAATLANARRAFGPLRTSDVAVSVLVVGGDDDLDLEDDLPDDESTGVKRPELQQAFDNLPSFLSNGVAH